MWVPHTVLSKLKRVLRYTRSPQCRRFLFKLNRWWCSVFWVTKRSCWSSDYKNSTKWWHSFQIPLFYNRMEQLLILLGLCNEREKFLPKINFFPSLEKRKVQMMEWSPTSTDLTPLELFLWEYLKANPIHYFTKLFLIKLCRILNNTRLNKTFVTISKTSCT